MRLQVILYLREPSMLFISFFLRKIQMLFRSKIMSLSFDIADFSTSLRFPAWSPCQTRLSRGTLYI